MRPSVCFYFLTLFFFSQSSSSVATTTLQEVTIVDVLCTLLGDYNVTTDYCLKVFRTDPSSNTADEPGLDVIAINLTIANATAITSKLDELLKKDPKAQPDKDLEDCYQLYSHLGPKLRFAANSVASEHYKEARAALNVTLQVPKSCHAPAINRENNAFFLLSNLAFAIADALARYS